MHRSTQAAVDRLHRSGQLLPQEPPKELTPAQKERLKEAQALLDWGRAKGYLNPLPKPTNSQGALDPEILKELMLGFSGPLDDPERKKRMCESHLSAAMQPHHTIGDLRVPLGVVREIVGSAVADELYEETRQLVAKVRSVYAPPLDQLDSADGTQLVPSVGASPIPPQP